MADDALDRALLEHETWLRVERGLAPNTLSAYRRDLRGYGAYLRARHIDDVAKVSEADVAAYVDGLAAAHDDEGKPRYRPASIARSLVAVRSLHRFCAEEGLAPDDPTAAVGAPRVPQGIPKALSEPEIDALLSAIEGDDPLAQRDRAILELLYGTGMRISECVGLDLDAFDFDAALVRVFGKGSKERVVPMGRPAMAAVQAYLDHGRRDLIAVGARRRGGAVDAVFLNARGTRLSRQSCWEIVRQVGSRVGLDGRLSPHVLRHSCATHMLDHGADIRVVQELLGHASLTTTQIYTKVSPERLRGAYEAAHPRAGRGQRSRSGR